MIAAQGGALDLFEKQERASLLSQAAGIVRAEQDGYVAAIDCVKLGFLAREFEASGGYGMLVPVKVGSAVKKGDALVRLYGEAAKGDALHALSACFSIVEARVKPDPLIYKTVT